ncbi:hypothetical protein TNCV_3348761 [Trichonephila clavipes]|nr:hypothetical protein TNCV_3348761 [Trichonephila clavipes]
MGGLMYTEKADMHYMYLLANGNGRYALRMYHVQIPDRRIPAHKILFCCYIVKFMKQALWTSPLVTPSPDVYGDV